MKNKQLILLLLFFPFFLLGQNKDVKTDYIKKPRKIIMAPMYRYIHSGISLFGGIVTNQMDYDRGEYIKKINYIGEIYYSNLNKFYGLGAFSYRFNKKEKSTAWEPWLGYKTMPFQKAQQNQGPLEYNKVTLGLRYYLSTNTCEDSYISLSKIFLNETFYIRESSELSRKINLPIDINRLSYFKRNTFNDSYGYIIEASIDNTKYKTPLEEIKNFTRLDASLIQYWAVSNNRNLSLRIYGGTFLQNDNSNNLGGANSLVRGSLSLISQGFNDYAYDNNFMTRTTNTGIASHQIYDNVAGGFKNAPTRGNIVGLSNKYIFSTNAKLDLFEKKQIKGKLFADLGLYESGKVKYLYSGGLQLGLLNRFDIFIPFFQSKEITQTYRDNKLNFFERITFSLDFKHHFTQRI